MSSSTATPIFDQALEFLLRLPPFSASTRDALQALQLRSAGLFLCFDQPDAELRDLFLALATACDSDIQYVVDQELDHLILLRRVAQVHSDQLARIHFLDLDYAPIVAPPAGRSIPAVDLRASSKRSHLRRRILGPMAPPLAVPDALPPNTALRDKEEAEKAVLIDKLVTFIDDAGSASTISARMQEQWADQAGSILRMLLGRGAVNTLRCHIGRWSAFAIWGQSFVAELFTIYPPSQRAVGRYILFRISSSTGHTIADSFCGTVLWMCTRLGMDTPDLHAPDLQALRESQIRTRSLCVKQSPAYPPDLLRCLEVSVCQSCHTIYRIINFVELDRCYASLRFDDAQHRYPHEARLTDFALESIVYKSKTDQKRTGFKCAALRAGLTGLDWAEAGWNLLGEYCPGDRDFWLPSIGHSFNPIVFLLDTPMEYDEYSRWAREARKFAIDSDPKLKDNKEFLDQVDQLTLHGARATMPTMMAHHGSSLIQMQFQGNWKSESMPAVYTRDSNKLRLDEASRVLDSVRHNMESPSICKRPQSFTTRSLVNAEDHDRFVREMYNLLPPDLPSQCAEFKKPMVDRFLQRRAGREAADLWLESNPEARIDEASDHDSAVSVASQDPDREDLLPILFYQVDLTGKPKAVADATKWHIASSTEPDETACNIRNIALSDMTPLGREPPDDRARVCARCLNRRPDIYALFP